MPRFTQEFIDRVLDSTDIVSLISPHTTLTKRGATYFGICPFHNEKTPSFSVTPSKQMYYCFGCQKGGNAITFVREINKYTFSEAVEYLAQRANIPVVYDDNYKSDSGLYKKKNTIFEINRLAANFYYAMREHSEEAKGYLARRGLSAETIRTYGLGYAPSGGAALYKYLKSKGIPEADMLETDLVRKNERGFYDYFRDRVMFPIQDTNDRIAAFGARAMGDAQPKYLNSAESVAFYKRSTLFNLNRAKRLLPKEPLILVEGYMDVISLYQHGIGSACASLGTSLSEEHARLIKRFTDNLILCYDGDSAGEHAALRAGDILSHAGLSPKIVLLPPEHDPDSFVVQRGSEEFLNYLNEHGQYVIDFKLDSLARETDMDDIVRRSFFVRTAAGYLSDVKDSVTKEFYAKKISELAGTSLQSVMQELTSAPEKRERISAPEAVEPSEEPTPVRTSPKADKTQIDLMRFVLESADNFYYFEQKGGSSWCFVNDTLREIFEEAKKIVESQKNVDIIRALVYNNKIAPAVSFIEARGYLPSIEEVDAYIKFMRIRAIEDEQSRIKKKIELMGDKADPEEMNMLFSEYSFINKLLIEQKKPEVT